MARLILSDGFTGASEGETWDVLRERLATWQERDRAQVRTHGEPCRAGWHRGCKGRVGRTRPCACDCHEAAA